MRETFIFIAHLLVTLAKLARPGGLGAVAAESLAVKHQLLIMKRAQRRAPNLTSWDRLVLGVCALLASPKRLSKMAVILKPSTLLCFHHALVKRKYRLLYSPRKRQRPGPKGPSKELIGVLWRRGGKSRRFRHLPDVRSRDREADTAAVPLFRSRSIVSLSSVARESSCA